jgi:hypothetical protein
LFSGAGLDTFNPNHQLLSYLVTHVVATSITEGGWAFPADAAGVQAMHTALESSELGDDLLLAAANHLQYDLENEDSHASFMQMIANVAGSMTSF